MWFSPTERSIDDLQGSTPLNTTLQRLLAAWEIGRVSTAKEYSMHQDPHAHRYLTRTDFTQHCAWMSWTVLSYRYLWDDQVN